jgi:CHAD domain-containing protein
MPEHLRAEHIFDVRPPGTPPPLDALPGVRRVGSPVGHHLRTQYFDTADLALRSRGIVLSRRTGGPDAGWQLDLPGTDGQREHHVEPLGAGDEPVPERFVRMTRARARGRPLEPTVHVDVDGSSTVLYGKKEKVLAEFTDDVIRTQSVYPTQVMEERRTWGLRLVDAPGRLVEAAEAAFRDGADHTAAFQGLVPAPDGSDGSRGSRGPGGRGRRSRVPGPKDPISSVLLAYVRQQAETLLSVDPAVRDDEPDAVHQMRVSARRLRSVLASYKKLVDPGTVARLREDLQWLASAVGGTRDIEVMRERLRALIAAEPPELLMGPVAQRIEEELGARYTAAREAALEALESDRYFGLLEALDAFVDSPPLGDAAGRKAGKAAARRLEADRGRVERAVAAAQAVAGTGSEQTALHEVRKCAKRLRYTAESVAPVLGEEAQRTAEEAEAIQEVLGEFQDSIVLRQLLRELAVSVFLEGSNAFALGRLHALEQGRAERAREAFATQWKRSHR